MGTKYSITVRVALKCAHGLLFKVLKNLKKGTAERIHDRGYEIKLITGRGEWQ